MLLFDQIGNIDKIVTQYNNTSNGITVKIFSYGKVALVRWYGSITNAYSVGTWANIISNSPVPPDSESSLNECLSTSGVRYTAEYAKSGSSGVLKVFPRSGQLAAGDYLQGTLVAFIS